MSKKNTPAQSPVTTTEHGTPFKAMTQGRKVLFVLKVLTCVLSFGFIFSDVMNS